MGTTATIVRSGQPQFVWIRRRCYDDIIEKWEKKKKTDPVGYVQVTGCRPCRCPQGCKKTTPSGDKNIFWSQHTSMCGGNSTLNIDGTAVHLLFRGKQKLFGQLCLVGRAVYYGDSRIFWNSRILQRQPYLVRTYNSYLKWHLQQNFGTTCTSNKSCYITLEILS